MPSPVVERIEMGFAEMVGELIAGKKLARLSWNNDDCIFLHAAILHIRNASGLHTLQLSEGDLAGTDWVVVREV